MPYRYEEEKDKIFSQEGQVTFLEIRDKVGELLNFSGAFLAENIVGHFTGSNWFHLGCLDRLVELGEIWELTDKDRVIGQNRVFLRKPVQ